MERLGFVVEERLRRVALEGQLIIDIGPHLVQAKGDRDPKRHPYSTDQNPQTHLTVVVDLPIELVSSTKPT